MIGGDVNRFIDDVTIQEVAVMYNGRKYFFHGLVYDRDTKQYTFNVAIWDDKGWLVEMAYESTASSEKDCIENFFNAPIFDGKKFWEAEKDMEWVEC